MSSGKKFVCDISEKKKFFVEQGEFFFMFSCFKGEQIRLGRKTLPSSLVLNSPPLKELAYNDPRKT